MEFFWDVANLFIVLVNIVFFMIYVMLNFLGEAKHMEKKHGIAGICMLIVTLLFDLACIVGFIRKGHVENCVIFILFIPLIGYFLCEAIKDIRKPKK